LNDQALAQAVLAGEPDAEEAFYKALQPRLFKAAAYFLGASDPEVDDVVQQAFLIVFQKLNQYDASRASLYTWSARICVNLCYQRLDKRRREQASESEALEAATLALARQRHREGEAEAEKAGLLALLKDQLKLLGEACRRAIELRDLRGLSYAEVGRALKVPIGTVMSRLARCRRALRESVEARLRAE
jgi:RNA polymerase sigma-70 factor (ECF subfamily)